MKIENPPHAFHCIFCGSVLVTDVTYFQVEASGRHLRIGDSSEVPWNLIDGQEAPFADLAIVTSLYCPQDRLKYEP